MARPQRISDEVLLEALTAAGEVTAGELASLLGIGQSTVAKRLAALEATGASSRRRDGRVDGVLTPDRWTAASSPRRRVPAPPGRAPEEDPSEPRPSAEAPRADGGRLRRGALGALVRDFLAAHPEEDLGPTQIGKALGRSQGAVANALARLANDGLVEEVSTSPRRYRALGTPIK
jgi:DNA-binding transcriptional ArsR family regulator